MKHIKIKLLGVVLVLAGCAETPEWTPGLVVDQMVALQVANPSVIDNPPQGVVAGFDGQRAENIIRDNRKDVGDQDVNEKRIRLGTRGSGL